MGILDRVVSRFRLGYCIRDDGCWEWVRKNSGKRYGRLCTGGERILAHRLSYNIHKGDIPAGMFVCHTCDYGYCVNPDHLFLGTHDENMADCSRKGRKAIKLSSADVHAIRTSTLSTYVLAREFGVAQSTIFKVIHRTRWRHVA